ncbi:MAG: tRNA 2-thiouridine(34) synthase MnmA [Candidatus Dojkabacteria bacterium]
MDPRFKKPKTETKVYAAISGGVDSAVSAALLAKEGYQVTGVYMKNWSGDRFGLQADCPWEQDQKDAQQVCSLLGIPFRSFNFEKQYRDKVVEYFFNELKAGRTPNPDIMCNKEIKFKLFLEKAIQGGADLIATGHYAQIVYNDSSNELELHKGIDKNKDQSYFLNTLTQNQLSRTLFPIGGYRKSEIRSLAKKLGLHVHGKPDSQGICFIGEINVKQYLRKVLPINHGDIVDIDTGEILGTHDGVAFYTIGQREGLRIGGAEKPYYVADKAKDDNILFVAMGKHNPTLYKSSVDFGDLYLTGEEAFGNRLSAGIRYRQKPSLGTMDIDRHTFTFETPQRAIAQGQSIVFYDNSRLVGGAVIQ